MDIEEYLFIGLIGVFIIFILALIGYVFFGTKIFSVNVANKEPRPKGRGILER